MAEGQIFFGGQLVGQPLALPTLNVELAHPVPATSRGTVPLTERYANVPDLIHLPRVVSSKPDFSLPFTTQEPAVSSKPVLSSSVTARESVVSSKPALSLPLTARERVGNFATTLPGYSARMSDASRQRRFLARGAPSTDTLSPHSIATSNTSARRAGFLNFSGRPGTEERRTGHIAAMDPTSLPKLHSFICKADVQVATESLGFAERVAAEHRKECRSKAKEKGRKQAQKWFKNRQLQIRKEQEIARELEESEERRRQEALAEAKLVADCRWKKAFERIKTRRDEAGFTTQSLRGNALESTTGQRGSETERSQGSSPVEVADDDDTPSPSKGRMDIHKLAKSLSWRAKEVPLDIHIEFLRKLRKLKNRATRFTQTYESRKTRYARLPLEERNLCEAAFLSIFGSDPFGRSLDMANVRDCLYEVGARGISLDEQFTVFKICEETYFQAEKLAKTLKHSLQSETVDPISQEARMAAVRGGINLHTFAVVLLPVVRKQLQAHREERIEDEFSVRDEVGSGHISIPSCLEILKQILRMDLDSDAVETRAKELMELEEIKEKEKRASQETSDGSIIAQMQKLKDAEREKEEKSKFQNQLTLEVTKTLVVELATLEQRKACEQERKVQAEIGTERDTFKMMRYDLPLLHMLYTDHSPSLKPLSRDECATVFREFGMPTGVCRHHVGSSGIDFDDLLHLVEQIRTDVESDAFNNLKERFEEYPGCNQVTHRLPALEVEGFLRSVRMTGRTAAEKEGLARALDVVFATFCQEDSTFGFEQVRRVLQRMQEYVRRQQHLEEVAVAHDCGFEEMELEELHDTFVLLDADDSGTIEIEEAWTAIKSLGFCMSKAAIRLAYAQIDDRNLGTLDFVQFLKLLEFMRKSEGDLCDRKVSKLSDLFKPEMLHLLTLLQITLDCEPDECDDKTLLQKLAHAFRIKENDPLEKKLHVRTFNELCTRSGDFKSGGND